MKVPKAIVDLITHFERLPGIGPKTAQRLTFYLLHVPQSALDEFASALSSLKKQTVQCSVCQNVAEIDPCPICSDESRDHSKVMVVEHPLDILVVEQAGVWDGVYHVLHGVIEPLENIGPDDLYINELVSRVERDTIREIILGMNPTMEGEATSLYIRNKINALTHQPISAKGRSASGGNALRVTRLGQGMPTGADIQYADTETLKHALAGRREY